MSKRNGPIYLNAYLSRLILGALGPLLLFSIFMMVLFARQEQANRRAGLESTARALALAIDQEVKSSVTNLESLATSEPLDVGAVGVFKAAANRILRTQESWQSLTLFDPQGRRVASVVKPLAVELTRMNRESLAAITRTRRPLISDFPRAATQDGSISIHVPVVRENTLIYILSAAIDPRVFTAILAAQKIPRDWVGTVYDANRVIIARSRDAKNLIGKPVGPLLNQTNVLGGEQFLHGVTSERVSAYAAVSRSQLTGWFFALTVPSSELDGMMYRSLAMAGGGGLALLLLGLFVALTFARRASKSIRELSAAAHDLGRGEKVTFPVNSPIAELDGLAGEMERTGRLLREREEERDKVEAALRKQEEDLQRQADLLNLANEAIFARELDSRIIYWNRGAEELYGYPRDEAIGSLSHELLGTHFPKGWDHFGAALLAKGEWSGELTQKTKDGRRIDVESRFKLIDDRAGGHVILECNRDITQRKRSARRQATEHKVTLLLAESETAEAAWDKILEIIGAGLEWDAGTFWLVDKQSQMLECQKTWHDPVKNLASCCARPPLARGMGLAGRAWQSGAPIWIPDVVKEASTLQLSPPSGDTIHTVFVFPIKLRNSALGVFEFCSTSIREVDDDVIGTVQAIAGEIGQFAERMRAEAALRQSEEHLRNQAQELEQQLLASGRLVAVGELTASMAHEFNNPLGIILGFAQGLLDSMDASDPNYQQVQIISEEAKRCEKLVQELLEFGRPKSADFARTDVEQIIERTINLVQPHAAKTNVQTVIEIEPGLPQMYADAQQLQQILLNLCLNAVDAMPKGGTLTVGAALAADGMIITVADTGIGIDADVLPRIFQPFFTSKKRRGLGLGLPICDRIVKSHGGKIIVDSRPGRGTTFKVHLPLVPPSASAAAPRKFPAAEAAQHP